MSGSVISAEERHRGFSWCREVLTGSWSDVKEEEFQIRQLSGGLSNLLYVCSLPERMKTKNNEPRDVLLRVYGEFAHAIQGFILNDCLTTAILSERNFGTKLYGSFPEGRLEQFLEAKTLCTEDISNPHISCLIAKKLANLHTMKMPFCKEPKHIDDICNGFLEKIHNNINNNDNKTAGHEKLRKVMSYDLHNELKTLRGILSGVNSPVVFCHNDLQEGNILYRADEADTNKKITFIDLEYSAYNHRGFDFGNHFIERCYDYSYEHPPYFKHMPKEYPSKEQQCVFLRTYMSALGHNDTSDAKLAEMCHEADVFVLASDFLWGVWGTAMSFISDIKFGYLDYALSRFDDYYVRKAQLAAVMPVIPDDQPC